MLHKLGKGSFGVFLILMLSAAALFSFGAVKKTGVYWTRFDPASKSEAAANLLENPSDPEIDSSGFLVVDVSNIPGAAFLDDTPERNVETLSLGIGPLPEVPLSMGDPDVELIEIQPGGLFDDGPVADVGVAGSDEPSEPSPVNVYWKTVTVKAGDTLGEIAEKAGLSIQDVVRANDLKHADRVREGQILYIPLNASRVLETLAYVRQLAAEEEALRKKALPLRITYYVVKDGDTLWSIAAAFDLDINTLFSCNKLADVNLLKPGTTLRIPNQDGAFVKVKSGESLGQIAEQNGAYIEAIVKANGMALEKALAAGQEIFVPGAKNITVAEGSSEKGARKKSAESVRSFSWPVRGQISSRFGWRTDPFGRRRDLHTGLDIRAPRGRGIGAAADGRVVFAGWMGGYGRTVVVAHSSGYTTLYGHCHKLIAANGQNVKRGQVIAQVGSTGRSTGNHVHFEIRTGGSPINPLRMLR